MAASNPAVTTVDLLRHAECEGGAIFRGSRDVTLAEAGWARLRRVAARVPGWQRVVSSPLARCRAFAESLAAERGLPLGVDERLREMHFGDWEGRAVAEVWAEEAAAAAAWWQDPQAHPPPGGEPFAAVRERARAAFDAVVADFAGQHVVLVAHGGLMRALLTTLPVGRLVRTPVTARESGRSVLWYPLVGLVIGALVAGGLALVAPIDVRIAGALALVAWVGLTGALHLDGLADATDALFAGHRDPERCLAVMRDPAAGPMAVVALILVLLTKWAALVALADSSRFGLMALVPVIARAGALALMATTAYRRRAGLASAMAAHLSRRAAGGVLLAAAFGVVIVAGPWIGIAMLAIAALVTAAWRGAWQRRIGGYTGDVIGGLIECLEAAVLVGAALASPWA